jgi:hypothetical protein
VDFHSPGFIVFHNLKSDLEPRNTFRQLGVFDLKLFTSIFDKALYQERDLAMSKESLRGLLEAQGTFPSQEIVYENFENLFQLANERKESVEDLAWGFLFSLDQMSQVGSLTDSSVIQRLQDWAIVNWVIEPYELRERLCQILVNVPSAKVLSFLETQRDQVADADVIASIDDAIAEISLD